MPESGKSSYMQKKKQLNKHRHDKGAYFVISAATATAEAVTFSAANKHSGDGEGSRWIRLLAADPPPPLATQGPRRAPASDPPPGGAPRTAALDPPPSLLT